MQAGMLLAGAIMGRGWIPMYWAEIQGLTLLQWAKHRSVDCRTPYLHCILSAIPWDGGCFAGE